MSPEAAEWVLGGLSPDRFRLGLKPPVSRRDSPVLLDPDGRLALDPSFPGLVATRREVRKLARPKIERQARDEHWARQNERRKAEEAVERERATEELGRTCRAIIRVLPDGGPPRAASILDVQTRSFTTLIGQDLSQMADLLAGYEVVIGLGIRSTLQTLGLDPDRWRCVDLSPPRKTRKLNRAGRKLSITPELLIASTTRIHAPLGDPSRVARYFSEDDRPRLSRRIESDLKSLWAFWRYGVLHGAVRLRWGFLDEMLAVEWRQPGEQGIHGILKEAAATRRPVDLVLGSAPGWSDPWSRAVRGNVVSTGCWDFVIEGPAGAQSLALHEIQAARIIDEIATDMGDQV